MKVVCEDENKINLTSSHIFNHDTNDLIIQCSIRKTIC